MHVFERILLEIFWGQSILYSRRLVPRFGTRDFASGLVYCDRKKNLKLVSQAFVPSGWMLDQKDATSPSNAHIRYPGVEKRVEGYWCQFRSSNLGFVVSEFRTLILILRPDDAWHRSPIASYFLCSKL